MLPLAHELDKLIEDDPDLSELYSFLGKSFCNGNPAEEDFVKQKIIDLYGRLQDADGKLSHEAITVWKDGTNKKWPLGDAVYAETDPNWLATIRL